MCGITGIVALNESGRTRIKHLERSLACLEKRGPDGNGTFIHEDVGLGQARLSVIDISTNASQPFHDNSGRYTIVFNGEFFNFQQYRQLLESDGVVFRSNSDTEVLLNLYIREGSGCLNKINGFFALAIYDQQTGELFLARDRYGVKPLLVYQDSSFIAFASEMKSLLAYDIDRNLDLDSVYEYLHLNYIPGPASIFKNVKKLEPGSWIKLNHGKITSEIWYQIPFSSISNSPQFSYQEAQHLLLEKMDEAVRLRLISDVPLGAFLSGGIDSSVIVALASKYTKKLNTFSIGYQDEPLFDETRYAKLVANKYNTNHTVFSLRNRDIFDHLHQVLNYIDEPFADSSALAVYILSEETRKHATVALSGDGADELFGGYMKHFGEWRLRNGGWKSSIVSLLGPLWESLPKSRNSAFGNRIRKLDKFSKGLKLGEKERYWQWCGYADEKYLKELSSFDSDSTELERRKSIHTKWIGKTGTMNDVLRSDMQLVLPGDMLTKVDLMSMANSLEVRTPFLDFNVVDFAFSLPADYKVNGNGRKLIVQDAFRLLLPEELYNRPKQGFEVPLLNWFRKELSGWIFDELLNESFIREQGLFRYSGIQNLQNQLNSTNPGDSVARLWGLIVFQNWYKNYSN